MRISIAVALLVALGGCSLAGPDGADATGLVAFRSLATAHAWEPIESATVLVSDAKVQAFVDRFTPGAEVEAADVDRETVVAVTTLGACPATNYTLEVTDVAPEGEGILVTAEVTRVGDAGGAALTYPVEFIAVEGLRSTQVGDRREARVVVRVTGDGQDCRLQQ